MNHFRRSIGCSKLDKVRNSHQIGNIRSKLLNGLGDIAAYGQGEKF